MGTIWLGGCVSELRAGSRNGETFSVTKLSSGCQLGSPFLKRDNEITVHPNRRLNNYSLSIGHSKMLSLSLSECRKRALPVFCNHHSTDYALDDMLLEPNGHPSGSIQERKRKFAGVLADGLQSTSVTYELTNLALPAIVGQALDPVAQLLETVFIGRLGPVELAAAGVAVSIFNIISKLFNVPLLSITTSFVAEEISQSGSMKFISEKLELPSVSTALLLAAVIGAVEALAMFIGARAFLQMMGISSVSPMHNPALQFLSLRALGAPAVVVSLAIQGVFRGFKDTRTPLLCVGIGNLSSIILLPLLAYVFGLGITGAAIATISSQYITTMLLVWFLSKRTVVLPPRIQELQFSGYMKSGGFLLGRTLSVLITMTLGTAMAARLGPLVMAAHQICLQIWLAVSLLSDALALSAQALIASSYAKHEYKRVKEITLCVLKTGFLAGVSLAIVLFMSFSNISQLFTKEVELLNIVRTGVVFVSATQPINALAFLFDGLHYGVSDFAYAAYSMMVIAAISSAVILYASPRFAIYGVWCGLTLFMTLRTASGFLRLCWRSGPWWFLQDNEVEYEPSYSTYSGLPVEEAESQKLDYAITGE